MQRQRKEDAKKERQIFHKIRHDARGKDHEAASHYGGLKRKWQRDI